MADALTWTLKLDLDGLSQRDRALIGSIACAYHLLMLSQAQAKMPEGAELSAELRRWAAETAAEYLRDFFPELNVRAERVAVRDD